MSGTCLQVSRSKTSKKSAHCTWWPTHQIPHPLLMITPEDNHHPGNSHPENKEPSLELLP